jgi:toxin YoeB
MARRLLFSPSAWSDYLHWQVHDARVLERVNLLIRECQCNPFAGIGKPEPLKREHAGCWSRRIDDKHRLVYRVHADAIEVMACRYHYSDR